MSRPFPRRRTTRARRGGARRCREAGRRVDRDRFARVQRSRQGVGRRAAARARSARALNWIPNAAGRALASTRTHITGAIIPTLDDQVFASQVAGMQTVMAEHGITLFLGCSNYDPAQALEQVRAMLSRGVEAVLVGEAYPPELFELLAMHRVPYVVTYAYRDDSPHCCIGFDNRAAFAQLTSPARPRPPRFRDHHPCRQRPCRRAARHSRRWPRAARGAPVHQHEGAATIAFGRASLRAIADDAATPDGRDLRQRRALALGALLEAQALGIDVPAQLSITGFDDIALARRSSRRRRRCGSTPTRSGSAAQALLDALENAVQQAGSCGAAGVAHAGFGCGAGAGSGRT